MQEFSAKRSPTGMWEKYTLTWLRAGARPYLLLLPFILLLSVRVLLEGGSVRASLEKGRVYYTDLKKRCHFPFRAEGEGSRGGGVTFLSWSKTVEPQYFCEEILLILPMFTPHRPKCLRSVTARKRANFSNLHTLSTSNLGSFRNAKNHFPWFYKLTQPSVLIAAFFREKEIRVQDLTIPIGFRGSSASRDQNPSTFLFA